MMEIKPYFLDGIRFNEGKTSFLSTHHAMKDKTGFRAALAELITKFVINQYTDLKVQSLMTQYKNNLKLDNNKVFRMDLISNIDGLLFFNVDLIDEKSKFLVEVKSSNNYYINYYLEQLNPQRINNFIDSGYKYLFSKVRYSLLDNGGSVEIYQIDGYDDYFKGVSKPLLCVSFDFLHSKKSLTVIIDKHKLKLTIVEVLQSITKPIGECQDGNLHIYDIKDLNTLYKYNTYHIKIPTIKKPP